MIGSTNAVLIPKEYVSITEWSNLQNVRFENDNASVITTYTGNLWGNSGCSSTKLYTQYRNYLGVRCRIRAIGPSQMFGLSYTDPDTNFTSIRWAAYQSNQTFYVYEMGAQRYVASTANLKIGDLLQVHVDGSGTVRYSVNGTVVYTSAAKVTAPVLIDLALMNANAGFNNFSIHGSISV